MGYTLENGSLKTYKPGGALSFDSDKDHFHSKFFSGEISLPSITATSVWSSDNRVFRTDSYAIGTAPADHTFMFGMVQWSIPSGTPTRLANDSPDKWSSFNGNLISIAWGDLYTSVSSQDRFHYLGAECNFQLDNDGGAIYLRDKIVLKGPFTNGTTTYTRTRPASLLKYRIFAGKFS